MSYTERDNKRFVDEIFIANTIFLNKAILATSLIAVPLLIKFIQESGADIFLLLALTVFVVSTLLHLFSFFISENAIEKIYNQDEKKHKIYEAIGRCLNRAIFLLICAGFVLILISVWLRSTVSENVNMTKYIEKGLNSRYVEIDQAEPPIENILDHVVDSIENIDSGTEVSDDIQSSTNIAD